MHTVSPIPLHQLQQLQYQQQLYRGISKNKSLLINQANNSYNAASHTCNKTCELPQ